MTQEKTLTVYQPNMSVAELRTLAMDFAKSGFFPDAKEAVQAVVKIQAGLELGFGPVYSMTKIYIVKGKVMVSAEALGAMVKRSGRYDYTVKTLTDTECALEFTDNGKTVYTSKFTMEDAKRADLLKADSGWQKYPRAMLMSKALSQGARIVCPHVIAGVYTPEDFGVETDAEGTPKVVVTEVVKDTKTEPPAVEMINETQRKRIFALAREKGWDEPRIHGYIVYKYEKTHLTDLTKVQANEVIEMFQTIDKPLDNTPGQPKIEEAQAKPEQPLDNGLDLDWFRGTMKEQPERQKEVYQWLKEQGAKGKSLSEMAANLSKEKAKELYEMMSK